MPGGTEPTGYIPANLVNFSSRLLKALDRILEAAALCCLVGIVVVVFLGIVSRYVLNASLVWTEEVGTLLFIQLIFLGVPIAHRERLHLSLDITSGLSERWQRLRRFFVDVVVAYSTINLGLSGYQLLRLLEGGQLVATALPIEVKFAIIPTTCAISLIYLLLRGFDERQTQPWLQVLTVGIGALIYVVVDHTKIVALPETSPSLVMAVAFITTLFLGVPIAFCLLFGALLANWGGVLLPASGVPQNMVGGASKFLILAIPLFLTAGGLMSGGGMSAKIIEFAHSLVGHLRAGLAQVNVVNSLLFGGISGSSSADAAIDSKVLVPQMVKRGYSAAFSCAITSASSILPTIVPPSISMLLYCAIADESVAKLFMAGYLPGLLICVFLMCAVRVMADRRHYGQSSPKATILERLNKFVRAAPVLLVAVFIIGGIRIGAVTPTEAGVVAVLWPLLLGLFVYREFNLRTLAGVLRGCAVESAMVGLLIAVATPFAWVLIGERVPQYLLTQLLSITTDKYFILLLLNIGMLAAGCFIDLVSTLLIMLPLVLPLIKQLGIDPIHFGIIAIFNLMIGSCTPPFGMAVLTTGAITRTPIDAIFREVTPFVGVLIIALLIITYVPAVSLALVWWTF